jgi:micrococcal nuclease
LTAALRPLRAAAAAVLLAIVAPAPAQVPPGARRGAIVKRVVDGDTLLLLGGERVRLVGVDAPELGDPDPRQARLARDAAEHARKLVERRHVFLELDPRQRDRHGRTLAYVFTADGRLLNGELVRVGLARAYARSGYLRRGEFQRLEREARAAGLGIWAGRSPRTASQPEEQRQQREQ